MFHDDEEANRRYEIAAQDLDQAASDPFRPPTWRWDAAEMLAAQGLPLPPACRNRWLHTALCFLKQPRGADALDCDPGVAPVAAAHDIYAANDLRRAALEGRLLTGASVSTTATACGLPETVVIAYEALFFDVGRAPQFLALQPVITANLTTGAAPLVEAIKAIAFYGGATALDVALAAAQECGADGLLKAPVDISTPMGRQLLRARLALAVMVVPYGDPSLGELARIRAALDLIESQERAKTPLNGMLSLQLDLVTAPSFGQAKPRPGNMRKLQRRRHQKTSSEAA